MELKAMSSSSRAGQRLGLATARRPAKMGRRRQIHRHDLGPCLTSPDSRSTSSRT